MEFQEKDIMDSYPFPQLTNYRQTLLSPELEETEDETSISSSVEMEMRRRRKSGPSTMSRLVLAIGVLLTLWLFMMLARPIRPSDKIPFARESIEEYLRPFCITEKDSNQKNSYFEHFDGHQECGIRSPIIYNPPRLDINKPKHQIFCQNRPRVLEALSGGGRHGFDAPYSPVGCQYRWYTTAEICMILERFDGIVFIGDDMLRTIYAAFNMLLRENIDFGGLKQWELDDQTRDNCRCDDQLTRPECVKNIVSSSEDVAANDANKAGHRAPYYCNRKTCFKASFSCISSDPHTGYPHFYLPITGSPSSDEMHDRFTTLLKNDPDSYKPIPVIHTIGLSTSLSWPLATASMDEWLGLADASGKNVPFLWVGPNAAGHLKPPGQILNQGNNALWHYTVEMAKEAQSRDVDALGMYNLTLQASSWDGSGYGLKVALVQAMMVSNDLVKLSVLKLTELRRLSIGWPEWILREI